LKGAEGKLDGSCTFELICPDIALLIVEMSAMNHMPVYIQVVSGYHISSAIFFTCTYSNLYILFFADYW